MADTWPSKGEIIFENVSLRYDANGSPVIKDLSLKIPAGQKVINMLIVATYMYVMKRYIYKIIFLCKTTHATRYGNNFFCVNSMNVLYF